MRGTASETCIFPHCIRNQVQGTMNISCRTQPTAQHIQLEQALKGRLFCSRQTKTSSELTLVVACLRAQRSAAHWAAARGAVLAPPQCRVPAAHAAQQRSALGTRHAPGIQSSDRQRVVHLSAEQQARWDMGCRCRIVSTGIGLHARVKVLPWVCSMLQGYRALTSRGWCICL